MKSKDSIEDEKSNCKYFIEEFQNKEDQHTIIYHLILAMNETEAGDYYNKFTYEFLIKQFNAFPIHIKFPIVEDIKAHCIANSYNIMVHPIESLDEFEESETEIKLRPEDKEGNKKELLF